MATYDEMKEELIDAYQNLLIVQYHNKTKAQQTIQLHIEMLLANMLLWKIRDGFNVDTSIGAQLDILGQWAGVDRYYSGEDFGDSLHLSLIDWDDTATTNQGGFRDWNNTRDTDGDLLGFNDVKSATNELNDDDFRWLVYLKILKNNPIMTCKNIDDAIYNLFDNDVYTTWNNVRNGAFSLIDWNEDEPNINQGGLQDWNNIRDTDGSLLTYDEIPTEMELTYHHINSYNAIIELAKEKNCLPVPTGVKINLQEIA